MAHPEVLLGLTAMCIVRGVAGFMIFLLAFGLRRMHAVGLYWYGLVLAGSGAGAMVGLVLVGRLRKRLSEQQLLLCSLWLIAISAAGAGRLGHAVRPGRAGLHGGAVRRGGPAFLRRLDPAAHPAAAQGRAFARFAMRQQLVWVVGALIPLSSSFTLPPATPPWPCWPRLGGLSYVTGDAAPRRRRASCTRRLPRLGDGRVEARGAEPAQPRRCSRSSTWSARAWGSRSPNLA